MSNDHEDYSVFAYDDKIPLVEKIARFTCLIDSMDSLSSKIKELWKQIYINAVSDRANANIMYNDLMVQVLGKPQEHAIHAPNINKYIERMSKATDQLIKLAEMLSSAEEKTKEIDADDMYKQLQQ